MKLTLGQVAKWIHAEGEFAANAEATGYSIDSRTVAAGELFFAVRGERFDGHDFVAAALAKGAVAAVVSVGWVAPEGMDRRRLLRVPDAEADCVLAGLQQLARTVRRHWGGRVVAITGSAGKTTTKDAVAQVLGARFRVLKSKGNLNNAFGLPLQLLKLEAEHEVAVVEMGMNHAGEIAALARITEPDWAVVSNVAPVHLEYFADGIAGIARAKYELIEALPPDGIAVLNCDDEFVAKFGEGRARGLLWTERLRRRSCQRDCRAWRGGHRLHRDGARRAGRRATASAGPAQRIQRAGGDCGGTRERHDAGGVRLGAGWAACGRQTRRGLRVAWRTNH